MPYTVAGIDIHKKVLMVVVSDSATSSDDGRKSGADA
jgi:hypothetical protein